MKESTMQYGNLVQRVSIEHVDIYLGSVSDETSHMLLFLMTEKFQ